MSNFRKYLPQNILIALQAIILWQVAGWVSRENLQGIETLFVWLIFCFLSYAVIEGASPKEINLWQQLLRNSLNE